MVVNSDLKELVFDGKTFHRVGCKKCGGGDWCIFTDGRNKFVAYCFCGYKIDISKAELQKKPDTKAIDMRMVV